MERGRLRQGRQESVHGQEQKAAAEPGIAKVQDPQKRLAQCGLAVPSCKTLCCAACSRSFFGRDGTTASPPKPRSGAIASGAGSRIGQWPVSARATVTLSLPQKSKFESFRFDKAFRKNETVETWLAHMGSIDSGRPFFARSVRFVASATRWPGVVLKRKPRTSVARSTAISSMAKLAPMQVRGPAPKGR